METGNWDLNTSTETIVNKNEAATAQTLRRGLAVLRLLARIGPSGMRISDIGRRLNLNKATAIRLTRTLVDEGFVLHDSNASRYRLGPEAFAIGLAAEPSYELQRLAAPTLRTLALESSDTVLFSVLHQYECIYLSRDEGDFPIRNQLVKPGDRWPLGVGACSLALLSAMPDAEIDRVLHTNRSVRETRFPRCTDQIIKGIITESRERGYVVQPGLVLEDSWAIGVVVHDLHAQPVAAIGIAALKSRLGIARCATVGNRLRLASRELEKLQQARS